MSRTQYINCCCKAEQNKHYGRDLKGPAHGVSALRIRTVLSLFNISAVEQIVRLVPAGFP